jgi:hypothetical protein
MAAPAPRKYFEKPSNSGMKKSPITPIRICAVPLLAFLYLACVPVLLARNGAHILARWMDNAFDAVCGLCGWDNRYWPLPKTSDEPLPRQ